jgi:hypothetical protein
MSNWYTIKLSKHKYHYKLPIPANDQTHIQALAVDIARSLKSKQYRIEYGKVIKSCELSELFKLLATNKFTDNCYLWDGSSDKKTYPCVYIFNERQLIKDIVLSYLKIPKSAARLKMTCGNTLCVNPHHFSYTEKGNRILTDGDRGLLLAYASQGASVAQLSKLFKVSRSTIYRNLNRERFSSGPESNCSSSRRR